MWPKLILDLKIFIVETIWKDIQGKYYSFIKDVKTYDDAISRCQKLSGKVFEPKDDYTNEAVLNWAKEKGMEETWIGIEINNHTGFVYASDSEPVGFTNWDENQPDGYPCVKGYVEPVVSLSRSKKWKSWPCSNKVSFICEKGKFCFVIYPLPTSKHICRHHPGLYHFYFLGCSCNNF